jgi:hypothetical protein
VSLIANKSLGQLEKDALKERIQLYRQRLLSQSALKHVMIIYS